MSAFTPIEPDQLPRWVPGRLTVRSPEEGWPGLSVRGYRYAGSDVEVPSLRDYVIVAYRRGTTPMHRRVGGDWIDEQVGPGDVSLLTRAVESHWAWPRRIEVVHVYLTQAELAQTCREMYEREVAEVELLDEVKADDPDIHRIAMLLAREAARGGPGSRLLVESLACQLGVYILRKHGHVLFREPDGTAGLSSAQERAVRDYVHEHLQDNLSVGDLAGLVDLNRFQFARRFKQSTGTTPHVHVMDERVARAKTLLRRTGIPLAEVAHQCGFADQSHMNRVFGGRVGTTPGQYREAKLRAEAEGQAGVLGTTWSAGGDGPGLVGARRERSTGMPTSTVRLMDRAPRLFQGNFGLWGTAPKKDSVNSWLAERRAGVSAIRTWPPPST